MIIRRKKKSAATSIDYNEWLDKTLQDKREAAAYLQVALDEYQQAGEVAVLLLALRNVAQAQGGIAALAEKTQLNRETLYRTLSGKGNPRLKTLGLVLGALGFHLSIEPL